MKYSIWVIALILTIASEAKASSVTCQLDLDGEPETKVEKVISLNKKGKASIETHYNKYSAKADVVASKDKNLLIEASVTVESEEDHHFVKASGQNSLMIQLGSAVLNCR